MSKGARVGGSVGGAGDGDVRRGTQTIGTLGAMRKEVRGTEGEALKE